jgi:hypothetical protein
VLTLTPAELITRRAVAAGLTHLFIDPPHIGDAISGRVLAQLTYEPSRRAQRPGPGLGSVPM